MLKTTANDLSVVDVFAFVARPVILDYFPPNSCIQSTHIAIECLKAFGMEAQPIAVKWMVLNEARKVAHVGGVVGKERDHLRKLNPDWHTKQEGGWAGHLIAVAPGFMIDASFDQANNPEHGLNIPPFILAVPVPPSIPLDSIAANLQLSTDNGELLKVNYTPSGDQSFYFTPAWESDDIQPAVRRIVRQMRKEIA